MDIENAAPEVRRKLTPARNAVLTIAVLAGFGLIGTGLYAFEMWIGAK